MIAQTLTARYRLIPMRKVVLSISLAFFAAIATAQSQPAPTKLAVHAAKLLDLKTGKTLDNYAIFVENGKIVKVDKAPPEIHQPKEQIDYPGFGQQVQTYHVFGTVVAGSVETGSGANFIAVDGDPTKDATVFERLKFVMKEGRLLRNEYVIPKHGPEHK